jgi:hypothetical protein
VLPTVCSGRRPPAAQRDAERTENLAFSYKIRLSRPMPDHVLARLLSRRFSLPRRHPGFACLSQNRPVPLLFQRVMRGGYGRYHAPLSRIFHTTSFYFPFIAKF